MQEYKIEEIILTYIRVSLGASIKFCNFRNIKSINKCSPYLWSQPQKAKVSYKCIPDYLYMLYYMIIILHFIVQKWHIIIITIPKHQSNIMFVLLRTFRSIQKISTYLSNVLAHLGLQVKICRHILIQNKYLYPFLNVILVFIKNISTVALYFTQSFQ